MLWIYGYTRYNQQPVGSFLTKQEFAILEDLTDDEVLQLVYREHRDTPIAMELARRLEIANDKLDATETQKGKSNES